MKSIDQQTSEYFAKCYSHVLDGETAEGLKKKKKEAPKADGHVLGADPNDKRGSDKEMVRKKVEDAFKSKSDLVKSIDAILEKAGIRQVNKVKEGGAAGPVKHRSLTEEQKKKYIEGSAAKVKAYRTEGYMPDKSDSPEVRAQDKDVSNKSMTTIVDALVMKAKGNWDGSDDPRKEEDPVAWKEKGESNKKMMEGHTTTSDLPTSRFLRGLPKEKSLDVEELNENEKKLLDHNSGMKLSKSLDDRTCDLVKDMSSQRERQIHDAVSTVKLARENTPETSVAAAKMDVNPDDVFLAASKYSGIQAARQAQKAVMDTWKTGSAFITKGARVMPVGPGGDVQDLSKDDEDDDSKDD